LPGFCFSDDEPTALVQFEGGPCAVLAPMQAYIIKYIVNNKSVDDDWKKVCLELKQVLWCVVKLQIMFYRLKLKNKIIFCVKPPVISFAKQQKAVIF